MYLVLCYLRIVKWLEKVRIDESFLVYDEMFVNCDKKLYFIKLKLSKYNIFLRARG